MGHYANSQKPPRTLTEEEAKRLLFMTGQRSDDYADHMIFALALGTGLRISEISALNCGDVFHDRNWYAAHATRRRVVLRVFKRSAAIPIPQEVMLSDGLRKKFDRFRRWKWAHYRGAPGRGESIAMEAPLFCVRGGRRMTKRRITDRFHKWRALAGLSDKITFHALRHTFCQRLYDEKRDVLLVQRAARHTHIVTTERYAQPSADDVLEAVQAIEL